LIFLDVPHNFAEVITAIAAFLTPTAEQIAAGLVFKATWKGPGTMGRITGHPDPAVSCSRTYAHILSSALGT